MKVKFVVLIVLLIVVLSGVFFQLASLGQGYQFVPLEIANLLMAALCLMSYFLVARTIGDRPQAFVRGVYSATLVKLIVCMFAVLIYVFLNRAHVHKPTIFVLFGLYIIYTVPETWMLSVMARKK